MLWELGVVDEFEDVSCASANGTTKAANTSAKKTLNFCFMGNLLDA